MISPLCRLRSRIGPLHHLSLLILLALMVAPIVASAQSPWKRTTRNPPINIDTAMVLTNGTVACHTGDSGTWCLLTPDSTGSYINGTWSMLPSLPSGYTPLYYASAVLPDGRMVILGGEYNGGNVEVWTNLGAMFDPATNKWSSFSGPPAWGNIGDAQCVVLADGRWMVADPFGSDTAIFDPKTNTWTVPSDKNKADGNDEEGWTLLSSGKLLTVDVDNGLNSEIFDPLANGGVGSWSLAGSTIVQLPDTGNSFEMGPQILRPDGTVICFGATGHNAVYDSNTGIWAAAPDFPLSGGQQLDCADAPACLLPNGNVLVVTSPVIFGFGAKFFVWNGATLVPQASTPNSPNRPSFDFRMVTLPTGQIMVTDGSNDVEIYTAGNAPQSAWKPTITTVPTLLSAGSTYTITGTQFNGLSQASHYGDDAASATNYPLVRVTSHTDGSVTYLKTHDHSTMAVATGGLPTSTRFDVPSDLADDTYDLSVVANGISSAPAVVTVSGGNLLVNPKFEKGRGVGWLSTSYVIDNDTFEPAHTGNWKAWLCGYGYTHTDTLSQVIALPSNVTTISLSFWLHIDTKDLSGSPHDKMVFQVINSGGVATTLATYTNANANTGYRQVRFDLSAYKGQTIRLQFIGTEDRVYPTSFVMDDFVLLGQ